MLRINLFVISIALAIAATAAQASEPRVNIVVFISDDHGLLDASVYGSPDVRTPNMDRLAREGMRFTHCFVASPSCAPSRAAMLSGLMPGANGAEANHTYMRDGIKALPGHMRDLGYQTAAFGKIAHGPHDAVRLGFEHVDPAHDTLRVAKYLDERDTSKPMCLFVGTHDPHVPWLTIEGYDPAALHLPALHVDTPTTRDHRAKYYSDVTRADREMGEILDLTHERLGPNTVFIYTSDHGAQWPFGKWNLYDAGIRIPLLVAWPDKVKAGTTSDALVQWIDLLPTLVELGGGAPPSDIDGRSFAGVFLGRADRHRDEIFTTQSGDKRMNVYPIRSVRTERYKYIRNLHPEFKFTTHIELGDPRSGHLYWREWVAAAKRDPTAAAIVDRYHRRPSEELYDLSADPFEETNLAGDPSLAEVLSQLRSKLDSWMEEQGDQQSVFDEPRLLDDE